MLKHLVFKRGKSNDRDMYFLLKVLLTAQMPKPLKDGTPAGGNYIFKVVAQVAKIEGLTGNPTFPSGCLSQEERSEALMDIKAMLRRGDVNEIPFDHPLKATPWPSLPAPERALRPEISGAGAGAYWRLFRPP